VVLALVAIALLFGASGASGDVLKRPRVRSAAPVQLRVVARVRGPNDPHDFDLSLLVPRRARLRQVWFLHGGRQPDQVLVEWVRSTRVSLYGGAFPDTVAWGLTLWTQSPSTP